MSMEPERVDLSPLDPAGDRLGYERLVHRIMAAASPELARRARATGPLGLVAGWAKPALAAAAVIVLVALGALVATDRPGDVRTRSLEALGVPAPAAEWLEEGREPTASDLVLAVERRGRGP